MGILAHLAAVVSVTLSYKVAQFFFRRSKAVWWRGLLIGFPVIIVAALSIYVLPWMPEWLYDITNKIIILSVMFAYENVKREQKEERTSSS